MMIENVRLRLTRCMCKIKNAQHFTCTKNFRRNHERTTGLGYWNEFGHKSFMADSCSHQNTTYMETDIMYRKIASLKYFQDRYDKEDLKYIIIHDFYPNKLKDGKVI
jgi:hypothetical protein